MSDLSRFGYSTTLLLCITVFLLASCASIPSQQKIRDFPLASMGTIAPPSLNTEKSGSPAFPDLYLLLDQEVAPILWKALIAKLPALLSNGTSGSFPQFDPQVTDHIQRLVIFQPAQEEHTLQGLLFGTFPVGIVKSALRSRPEWKETSIHTPDSCIIPVFSLADSTLQLALINDACIAVQNGLGNFESHVLRAYKLGQQPLSTTQSSSSAIKGSFQEVLDLDAKGTLFILASIGLNGILPASGLRIRVQPEGSMPKDHVNMRLDFLVRDGSNTRVLKTGVKLFLLGTLSATAIGSDFLNNVRFTESGTQLSADMGPINQSSAAIILENLIAIGTSSNPFGKGGPP